MITDKSADNSPDVAADNDVVRAEGIQQLDATEARDKGDAPGAVGTPDAETSKPKRGRKTKNDRATAQTPKADPDLNLGTSSKKCDTSYGVTAPATSKLDRLLDHLRQPGGTTISDLMAATGWQAHSVRGAMAGALRKKGYSIVSEKPDDGTRRYRTVEPS